MSPRRQRPQVDERTQTMSDEALQCRSIGHAPVMVPTPAAVRAEYRKVGQRLLRIRCERGCSYWREIAIDEKTGITESTSSGYDNPGEYLVQTRGTGRLPRSAARVAFFQNLS